MLYSSDHWGDKALKTEFQGHELTLVMLYIVHKMCVGMFKIRGHIYLQTLVNNPSKKKFKRTGFQSMEEDTTIERDQTGSSNENGEEENSPIMARLDFPDETTIVNMDLHCDYFRDISGTSLPQEIPDDLLVPGTGTCCAGKVVLIKRNNYIATISAWHVLNYAIGNVQFKL